MPETPRELPRIPFDLYDYLYFLNDYGEIAADTIWEISYGIGIDGNPVWEITFRDGDIFYYPTDWGVNVFATEEEALEGQRRWNETNE